MQATLSQTNDATDCLGALAAPRDKDALGTLPSLVMQLGVFLSALVCPMDFSADGAKMSVGLEPQVLAKLAVAGMCALLAAWSLLTRPDVRRVFVSLPSIIVIGILALAIPAAVSSSSSSALPAVCVNLVYVIFVPAAILHLGLPRTIGMMTIALSALLALAWFLYFFVPTYGVFPELLGNGLVQNRLGGVGHPNSVGRLAAIALTSLFYLMIYRGVSLRFLLPLIIMSTLALIFAQSRTSILCLFVGFSVVGAHRFFSTAGLVALGAGAIGGLVLMIGVFAVGEDRRVTDRLLGLVSKTGKAEELTSGTGRTDIWSKGIELIAQRPLTGHGFGAAASLMVNHSQSTHNTVLHASMVAGVGGGALMLFLQGWLLAIAVMKSEPFIRASSVLLVMSGLVEDTVLETFPGPASMLWLTCILYPVLHSVANSVANQSGNPSDELMPTRSNP